MAAALLLGLLLGSSLGTIVKAVDTNSSPCDGRGCSWVLENHHSLGKTQSMFRLDGSSSAISDLTAAAGWTILDCETGVKAQTIRAVCTGGSTSCDQLHEGGAEHTLVRLPENCGNGLFARVVSEHAHENQTLPDDVRKQLRRRGQSRSVRAITIDTRFSEVDPSIHGPVTFSVDGKTSLPGRNSSAPPSGADFVSSSVFVPSSTSASSTSAAPNATDVGTDNPTSFDKTGSSSFHVDEQHDFTLVDQTINCEGLPEDDPNLSEHITVKTMIMAQLDVKYGVHISGTVIPLHVKDFDLFAQFNASLLMTGIVDIFAEVMINTGNVTFFQAGLPGISISDVLDIGPFFQLSGDFNASATADVEIGFSSSYEIQSAEIIFPPSSGTSTGLFQQDGSLSVFAFNHGNSSNGIVELALTPAILFGVSIFDGKDKATIGLNMEGQASMSFDVNSNATDCFASTLGISVNADAEGQIEGIFDKSLSFVIFEDEFEGFKAICPTDTSVGGRLPRIRSHTKRSLECIPGSRMNEGLTLSTTALPPGPFLPANTSTSM